jgi:hypothetical protein
MSPSRAGAILGAWLLLVVPGLSFVRVRTTFPQSFSAMRARKGYVACAISKTERLRQLLNMKDEILIMPCAYDALSAKLIEMHGFEAMFMTGFGVAGVRGEALPPYRPYMHVFSSVSWSGQLLALVHVRVSSFISQPRRLFVQNDLPSRLTMRVVFALCLMIGHPDTQLVSYGEMVDTARMIGEVSRGRNREIQGGATETY